MIKNYISGHSDIASAGAHTATVEYSIELSGAQIISTAEWRSGSVLGP